MTDHDLLALWMLRIDGGCDDATAKRIDALLARVEEIQRVRSGS